MGTGTIVVLVLVPIVAVVTIAVLFRVVFNTRGPAPEPRVDPPGFRTFATFKAATDPEHQDDGLDGPRGRRLFERLCEGLTDREVPIENVGELEYARSCVLRMEAEEFTLLLGYVGDNPQQWLITVDRADGPSAAVKPPKATTALRHLLANVHRVLRRMDEVSEVQWHRRENHHRGDYTAAADRPYDLD